MSGQTMKFSTLSILIISILLLTCIPTPVFGATITVNSTADDNDSSWGNGHDTLREAIIHATAGDTIQFSVTGTITLTSTLPTINKNLTISGPGATSLTITGNNSYRVFSISVGTVSISGLTIKNGKLFAGNDNGAGFYITGGTVTVDSCAIDGCTILTGGSQGAAFSIQSGATLNLTNSAIINNQAESAGAIINFGTTNMTSCTISGNTSEALGVGSGGVVVNSSGTMSLLNCTITNNSALQYEGGLYNYAGTTTIKNSIIAGNIAQDAGGDVDLSAISATFTSQGYNIIGVADGPTTNFTSTTGDQTGTGASPLNAKLNALDTTCSLGGKTPYHSLQATSPAINNGTNTGAPTSDQRGYLRSGTTDIGSFEYGGTIPVYAPTVTTNAASSITTTGATLNGAVNANNGSTTVTFEYGLTTGYGTTVTADESPVTGSSNTSVSKAISGLTANTLYHFRAVGVNASGTTNGSDLTFTTSAAAPTVTTNAASGVTTTGATLNGTVNANNASTTATFEYGLTTGYGTSVTADESPVTGTSNTSVSKSITGLAPNTLYHYRAVGVNAGGTTNGGDLTFTTSAAAPAVTTNAASGLTTTGATLNGTVNANNQSSTVTFEYGLTTGYGTTVTADESPVTGTSNTSVSKSISGLTPNTLIHFRVIAVNATGTTNGLDQTFTTSAAAPTVTTNAATSVITTGATLNGTVNANNASSTVTFEYGLTTGYGTTVTADQSPVNGTSDTSVSKAITGLTPNTLYHYRAVGVNAGGTTNGGDLTFTTSAAAPTATTNAASSVTTTGATLNGTVNANNQSSTVTFEYGLTTGYGTTVTADESPVTGTSNTSVSKGITGLTPNTLYHFRVIAVNATGTTNGLDQTFTTSAAAPTVTTNAAGSVTTTGATLNGTVNANNASTTVTFEYGLTTGYGTTVTADQSPVTGTSDTSVSKAITGLTPNTLYHYRVVGVNAGGTTNGGDLTFTTLQAPPTATTNAASSITTTGATLNGAVNANNLSSTVTFEYGLTTGYGTTVTADESPVTGISNASVSKTITGLTPNTLYHFRVIAVNGAGTTNGLDQTFTTSAAAPTVTTNAASSLTTTGATLNGTVNANNASSTVTFEYGLTTGYGTTVTADQSPVTGTSDTSVSKAITGLAPNTLYHYRVVGVNAGGTTNGGDLTFTTSMAPPTATTNTASSITTTGATLNGAVNANNASATVTFEYGLTTGYGTTVTADQSPVTGVSDTAVSKAITGLTSNTLYHFRVIGVNGGGTTNGLDQTFTTSTAAPTATTNAAGSVTSTGAMLNGTVNANNGSATVTFEYGLTTGYGTTVTADQSPVTGTSDTAVSKAITGLTPNTLYHYRVVGVNAGGTTNGGDLTFTTAVAPPTATTDAASSITVTGATLNGTVNANNGSATVTFEYGLTTAYGTTVTADQSPVTGTSDTAVSKAITGLTSSTLYHFRVIGVNAGGTTNGLDQTFTTSVIAPVATAATNVLSTSFSANWNATTGATGYRLDVATDVDFADMVTGYNNRNVGNVTTFSVNTNISPGSRYYYRVRAYNSVDTSENSNVISLQTGPTAPTAIAASAITQTGFSANWNPRSGVTGYRLDVATDSGFTSFVTGYNNLDVGNVTTYSVNSNINPGITYYYRLRTYNASGTSSNSNTISLITIPGDPIATAATNILSTSFSANWNAVTGASRYYLDVATDAGFTTFVTGYNNLNVGNVTTYSVNTNLTPLTPYYYRVRAYNINGTSGNSNIISLTTIAALPTITTTAITNITSSSAVSGGNITDDGGAAVTARGVCWSVSHNPTTANSSTSNGTGAGTFTSNITGLTEYTTYYVRAYGVNSTGTAYGNEVTFRTNAKSLTVTITTPTDGAVVSGIVPIAATVVSQASDSNNASIMAVLRVEFYVDNVKIAQDTTAPYETTWDTASVSAGSHTIKAIAYNAASKSSQDEITVSIAYVNRKITVNRTELYFGAISSIILTGPQTILIDNGVNGKLQWTMSKDTDWLSCAPLSGTGSGVITVSVNPSGLSVGTYSGVITLLAPQATTPTITVPVTLKIYSPGSTLPPFGSFDSPTDGATVQSSVPVTGWVLDDIDIENVKIYRAPIQGEGSSFIFIGNAIQVDGARPDVESAYPGYPKGYLAGWGYMLLTNFLPNGGNGTFTLYAKAIDKEGHEVTLGGKTITCVNSAAVKPFGAIDTPTQGGTAAGANFVNFGWALTPLPNTIPINGSTISVLVDSVFVGRPVYNQYRADIATLFPGLNNSNGAVGYFYLDTTKYTNGVHTIAWIVTDNAGNTDGIGSRYFTIANSNSLAISTSASVSNVSADIRQTSFSGNPVYVTTGYSENAVVDVLYPDQDGTIAIDISEGDRVEIKLNDNPDAQIKSSGYLEVNDQLRPLPIGSTLNVIDSVFSWQAGPGFLGAYKLVFALQSSDGLLAKKVIKIIIHPKY